MEINLTQWKYMTIFIEFIHVPSGIVRYNWDSYPDMGTGLIQKHSTYVIGNFIKIWSLDQIIPHI